MMNNDNKQQLISEIKQIISEVTGLEIHELKETLNLFSELGVDSLKAIEIVVAIQAKFKIQIDDDKILEFTTVKKIADEIENII